MAEQKSDVEQMIERHGGSSDPGHRTHPFGGDSGFDPGQLQEEQLEQEQQRAAAQEPAPDAASEESEPELHPDELVHFFDGRIDADGYEIEEELPPEVVAAAVTQMQDAGYTDAEIDAALAETGITGDPYDEPGTPAEEVELAGQEEDERAAAYAQLVERRPEIQDERVQQAMLPELQTLAEWNGRDYVRQPEVLERVLERIDPDGTMAAQIENEGMVDEIFPAANSDSPFK